MEAIARDTSGYVELYNGYRLEVRAEQLRGGERALYRVLFGEAEVIGWRRVHVDGEWLSERSVVDQVMALARGAVQRELLGGVRAA